MGSIAKSTKETLIGLLKTGNARYLAETGSVKITLSTLRISSTGSRVIAQAAAQLKRSHPICTECAQCVVHVYDNLETLETILGMSCKASFCPVANIENKPGRLPIEHVDVSKKPPEVIEPRAEALDAVLTGDYA